MSQQALQSTSESFRYLTSCPSLTNGQLNSPTVKVSFPTDNSNASQSTRITAALITLQNLNGPGKGCPAASTTLLAQQKAL